MKRLGTRALCGLGLLFGLAGCPGELELGTLPGNGNAGEQPAGQGDAQSNDGRPREDASPDGEPGPGDDAGFEPYDAEPDQDALDPDAGFPDGAPGPHDGGFEFDAIPDDAGFEPDGAFEDDAGGFELDAGLDDAGWFDDDAAPEDDAGFFIDAPFTDH